MSRSEYFIAHFSPESNFAHSMTELALDMRFTGIVGALTPSKHLLGIGLIAVVAHTEAFFKNEFAALVNIYPSLLIGFSEKRPDNTKVDVRDLIQLSGPLETNLGFLISEKQDFGRAKKINGLYRDLIKVTPFSEDDAEEFDRLLNDRNLLVHHGGVFTSRHDARRIPREVPETQVFYDALEVTKTDLEHWANFVSKVVRKTTKSAYEALVSRIEESPDRLPEAASHALSLLKPMFPMVD